MAQHRSHDPSIRGSRQIQPARLVDKKDYNAVFEYLGQLVAKVTRGEVGSYATLMSGRMNWDRVRSDSSSFHHGTERVNAHSHPTKAAKPKRQQNNTLHPKNCRCKACKAYLLLIKELNPQRFKELTQNIAPITRPESETKRRFAHDTFGLRNSRVSFPKSTWKKRILNEIISPNTPLIGCTCGKTFGFIGLHQRNCALLRFQSAVAAKPLFKTEAEREVALATLSVLKQFERLVRSNDLRKPENMQGILGRVRNAITSAEGEAAAGTVQVDIQGVVSKAIDLFIKQSIDIPKVVLVRNAEVIASYDDFDLDLKGIQFKPQAKDALSHLHDRGRCLPEARLEDYIVRSLVDFEDVSYNNHYELLYKLAGVVVRHVQSYLPNEDDVRNVLQFHQAQLVNLVYCQMQAHQAKKVPDYEVNVTDGFTTLRPKSYFIPQEESHRDFRCPVDERLLSKGVRFGGFKRCLSASQRFHSDAERRFAMLLEDQNDPSLVRWIKPEKGVFQIYCKDETSYEPEFLVETRTAKLICDIRKVQEIETSELQDNAKAVTRWCEYATAEEKQNGGKAWSYLIIPDDAVRDRIAWARWKTRLKIESPMKFEGLFG